MGTYVHEDRGGQLAAARGGLSIGVSGVGAHIAKQFFRDEEATHMENITKSVNFACGQLRLSKDAAADAKALVVKACDGRWGDGEWTTMLTGACVYAASRQNQLPITVRDVAEACQLDVFALGRVYNRLKFLHELKVPPLDPGKFVARAAAAIPELREAIDASSAGADNDETGPSAPAPVRRSRLNVERPGNNNADKPTPAVDRGAKLAPVIEDARRLLTFADTRGLMTGRGPFPMVAAALGLAAQCRGIALEPAALAKGARASESSSKRASASLRRELSEFARSYAWGEGANSKGIDTFLPLVLASLADAIERKDFAKLEAMPVSYRVAESVRNARLAKIDGCKVTGSLLDDDDYDGDDGKLATSTDGPGSMPPPPPKEPGIDGASGALQLAVAKPPRSAKRQNLPNRGGLKPRRRRKRTGGFGGFSGVDDEDEGSRLAIAPPKPPKPPKPPPPAAARLLEGTENVDPKRSGLPSGWSDVLIQQLLLAGVPERLVVEEDGLFTDIVVDGSGVVKPTKAPVTYQGEMEAAEEAAHRVMERWNAETSRDPLLTAETDAANAGDVGDEKATMERIRVAREGVEKADAEAIAAIPDEDVARFIRTEEEAAMVKAMAARRLVQFDADDGNSAGGGDDDGDDRDDDDEGFVPVVKGEEADAKDD